MYQNVKYFNLEYAPINVMLAADYILSCEIDSIVWYKVESANDEYEGQEDWDILTAWLIENGALYGEDVLIFHVEQDY
jgi:hypothetical protein